MIHKKEQKLIQYLNELGSAAIGFSGGVDSTYLLKVAHDALGDRAIAVTVKAAYFPGSESKEAEEFCRKEGITQLVIPVDVESVPHFTENPSDRCYYCKKALFTQIKEEAEKLGICHVLDGSNIDDDQDYRPGHRAITELGIISPLRTAGMTKEDIRILSKAAGLPTYRKPSFACLASRFVYGEQITREKLRQVELAEEYLNGLGLSQLRVRVHGTMARIELLPEEMKLIMEDRIREGIYQYFKELGFAYTSLDLKGFRSGSMNEVLE